MEVWGVQVSARARLAGSCGLAAARQGIAGTVCLARSSLQAMRRAGAASVARVGVWPVGWPPILTRRPAADVAQQEQQSELVEDVAMVVEQQRGDVGRHDGEGDEQVELQQVRSDGDGERVDGVLVANEWSRRRGEASCFELHALAKPKFGDG